MNRSQAMKLRETQKPAAGENGLTTELLLLPDGRILVHNLTQPFAELLGDLNPGCEQITSRILSHHSDNHEFPD